MSKNILLITLDSVGNSHIESKEDLENIKKLRENGHTFSNAYSVGPGTPFSFPAIIGSIYPYFHGTKISQNVTTIDESLKSSGYNTCFINESNAFLSNYFGYGDYFDYHKDFLGISHSEKDRTLQEVLQNSEKDYTKNEVSIKNEIFSKSPKAARKLLRKAESTKKHVKLKLKENHESIEERRELYSEFSEEIYNFIEEEFEEPQFMWIHTILNHHPYVPKEESDWKNDEVNKLNQKAISGNVWRQETANEIKKLFLDSLETTDEMIGNILDKLESKGELENTIIVFTADHGEEFLENGYFGHTPESTSENLLNVPLTIKIPKEAGKEIEEPVSTIDILPTITDYLGVKTPETAQGKSLKKIIRDGESRDENLYSQAWMRNGLLDKNPGTKSVESYFSVRNRESKLKIRTRDLDQIENIEISTQGKEEKSKIKQELLLDLYSHLNSQYKLKQNLDDQR